MSLLLVLRFWKEGALIALCLALIGLGYRWEHELVAKGRAEERARVADSVLASIAPEQAKAETTFVHDTVRLARLVTRFDTLRETVLEHLHDTAFVDRFVTVADSTVHACRDALGSCEQAKALLAVERDQWRAKAEAVPIVVGHNCIQSNVIIGVLGVGLGFLAHR